MAAAAMVEVDMRATHRLVVPVTFLPELRAEQTTMILFEARLALR